MLQRRSLTLSHPDVLCLQADSVCVSARRICKRSASFAPWILANMHSKKQLIRAGRINKNQHFAGASFKEKHQDLHPSN